MRIATSEGEVALWCAGTGPKVLLLHGWEGQASDLAAFASPLLDAGFAVLAMDLPAHGASSGREASIPHLARALRAVGDALGPLHAVIAHSMGAAVLAETVSGGLLLKRAVLIAAPADYERYARGFAAGRGLDAADVEAMLALLGATIGEDMREISLPRRAPRLRQPALFIHSSDDRVVPIEDSLASAAAWPGARQMRVEGLGHRRILGDPAVIAAATAFVTLTHPQETS
ncbi:MAG: alpha/beta fold hydrolase [Rhodanobacteraceae bacterium]